MILEARELYGLGRVVRFYLTTHTTFTRAFFSPTKITYQ